MKFLNLSTAVAVLYSAQQVAGALNLGPCSNLTPRKKAIGDIPCENGKYQLKDTDIDYLIRQIEGDCKVAGGMWTPTANIKAKDGSVHKMWLEYEIYTPDLGKTYIEKVYWLAPWAHDAKDDCKPVYQSGLS